MRKPSAQLVTQLVIVGLCVWIEVTTGQELVDLHASTGLILICLLSVGGVFSYAAADAPRVVAAFRRSKQPAFNLPELADEVVARRADGRSDVGVLAWHLAGESFDRFGETVLPDDAKEQVTAALARRSTTQGSSAAEAACRRIAATSRTVFGDERGERIGNRITEPLGLGRIDICREAPCTNPTCHDHA